MIKYIKFNEDIKNNNGKVLFKTYDNSDNTKYPILSEEETVYIVTNGIDAPSRIPKSYENEIYEIEIVEEKVKKIKIGKSIKAQENDEEIE